MSDLQYVTYNPENKTNHVSFVMFTTQQLLDLDKTIGGKCTDYSIGSMIRFTVTEFNDLKNEKYGPGVPDAVKIGDYYYSFFVPPEACLANEQFTEMEVKQTSVLKDIILKNLRKVSMK